MTARLHRYKWDGHQFHQSDTGEWVKFAEAEATIETDEGMIRLINSTLEDQRRELRAFDQLKAEMTKLKQSLCQYCRNEMTGETKARGRASGRMGSVSDVLPKLSDLPELTEAEREAIRNMDMTEVLGTWEERFYVAKNAALRWFRERNQLRAEVERLLEQIKVMKQKAEQNWLERCELRDKLNECRRELRAVRAAGGRAKDGND